MESVTSFFSALLAAEFPKVAGMFGLAFLFFGVVRQKIVLGPVAIPRRDTVGRVASLVLGFLLVCVPLIQLSWGSVVALYSAPTRNSITVETRANGQSFLQPVGTAYAAEKRYTIKVSQRSVLDTSSIFGGKKISLYVGDIHLTRPNTILFFRASSPESGNIKSGTGLSEADIRRTLPGANVIFLDSLTQGQTRNFSVDAQRYTLTVEGVTWSIIGDDSLTLSVRTDLP